MFRKLTSSIAPIKRTAFETTKKSLFSSVSPALDTSIPTVIKKLTSFLIIQNY
jgi:hypothetical protein